MKDRQTHFIDAEINKAFQRAKELRWLINCIICFAIFIITSIPFWYEMLTSWTYYHKTDEGAVIFFSWTGAMLVIFWLFTLLMRDCPPYTFPTYNRSEERHLSGYVLSRHKGQWQAYDAYHHVASLKVAKRLSQEERQRRREDRDLARIERLAEEQAKQDVCETERAAEENEARTKTSETDRLVQQYRAMPGPLRDAQPQWIKDAARVADINFLVKELTGMPQDTNLFHQWPYTHSSDYHNAVHYTPLYDSPHWWKLEQLPDLCPLYRKSNAHLQEFLAQQYTARLAGAHTRKGTSDPPSQPITPHNLSNAARVLFLPFLVAATDGYRFNELDLERSDLPTRRYVYRAAGSIIDLEHWEKAAPKISQYLGQDFNVTAIDGESLELQARPDIPASFPMTADMLKPGQLFFGLNLKTGQPLHVPITHLSHMLMQGPSGAGKSTFMHQLMASVLTNMKAFEAVYLVDLKFGLEAQHYRPLHDKTTVIESHSEVSSFIDSLMQLMETPGLFNARSKIILLEGIHKAGKI